MQFKLSFATLALATLAAATATPSRRNSAPPASECNTGPVQCCDSTEAASTPSLATIFSLLGIDAQGVTGIVGLTCTPITVIGAGGDSCTAQPVCCTNNSFKGVVALGCTPVNLSL